MANSDIHVLHCHNAHGARCAVGVGVNHQIQAGEVADDQVGEVAKPQITRCHLVGQHAGVAVDFSALHEEDAGAGVLLRGLQVPRMAAFIR